MCYGIIIQRNATQQQKQQEYTSVFATKCLELHINEIIQPVLCFLLFNIVILTPFQGILESFCECAQLNVHISLPPMWMCGLASVHMLHD